VQGGPRLAQNAKNGVAMVDEWAGGKIVDQRLMKPIRRFSASRLYLTGRIADEKFARRRLGDNSLPYFDVWR
jgi:hypothetical protein